MNHLKRKPSERFAGNPVSLALWAEPASTPASIKDPLSGHPKTLIVIPSYNEAPNIGGVLEDIRKHVPEIPVLVIDDGSVDDTASIAEAHGARVISLPYNSGYGVALQTGYIYALKNDCSLVIQMDADGQHDPACIIDLLAEIQKGDVDVVIGSRFLGENSYRTTLARRSGMVIFGKLASLFCRTRVSDPTSGFQAVKGKAIRFVAGDCYPPDYPDADFLIMLNRCGFRVREIPVKMHPNRENKSMHRGPQTIYYVFKMFLSIFVTLLRTKPRL